MDIFYATNSVRWSFGNPLKDSMYIKVNADAIRDTRLFIIV